MKNFKLLIVIGIVFFLSCSKNETVEPDCSEWALEEFDMTAYKNQDPGCNFFLELFQYQNKQYFLLGNHCADIISYPTDCQGIILCESGSTFSCERFYSKAKNLGIIGIRE